MSHRLLVTMLGSLAVVITLCLVATPPPRPAALTTGRSQSRDQQHRTSFKPVADLGPKPGSIVINGECYQLKGACHRSRDGVWAMLKGGDAFEVLEVVEAPSAIRDWLVHSSIKLRRGDEVEPASGKLRDRQVYTMMLRPNDETWNKIAENRRTGIADITVSADELAIISAAVDRLSR